MVRPTGDALQRSAHRGGEEPSHRGEGCAAPRCSSLGARSRSGCMGPSGGAEGTGVGPMAASLLRDPAGSCLPSSGRGGQRGWCS